MKKIALAVMRLQPFHDGHKILIDKMLEVCDEAIIAIGSTQEAKTNKNPYTYEQRKKMVLDAYPQVDNLHIIPLVDINAKSKKEWVNYLIGELKKKSLFMPTDYFSGSMEDAAWYTQTSWNINIIDRYTTGKGINATNIRESMKI